MLTSKQTINEYKKALKIGILKSFENKMLKSIEKLILKMVFWNVFKG